MPDDSASPSAGWRDVYDELCVDPDPEEPAHPCPDCGLTCRNVLRDVYECADHGVFRAARGADAEDSRRRSRHRAE